MPLPRLRVALLFLAVPVTVNGEAFAFEHNMPGEFDYYALVLGCPVLLPEQGAVAEECQPDKPRAFVLHGLWPQYDKSWPEDCTSGSASAATSSRGRAARTRTSRGFRINKIAVPPVEPAKP